MYDHQCGECPDGYYGDLVDSVCKQCLSPCYTCVDGTELGCTSCIANYYLWEGSCVTPCPENAGLYERSTDNTCADCGEECETCVEDLTKAGGYRCTECAPPMLLHGDSCVYECSGWVSYDPDTCNDCLYPCEDFCISDTECTAC